MPSPISRTPPPTSGTPRWVRATDILCLALIVLAVVVSMSGGFRQHISGWQIAVTSPYPLLLWAFAIGIVRHFAATATPIYRDLPRQIAAWWQRPDVHTAAIVVVGTRPAILFVGYMAVLMFGYVTSVDPPTRQVKNELAQLPARWDENWYLIIATDGYDFARNQPRLHQRIAFFPAYPILVRGAGRILGGYMPGYIGAGLLVSLAAFFGALIYLYALARDTLDEDDARYALWLTATYPFAIFFGAIYAESLLLLGLVATVYHFKHEQFGRAALWGVLAGLTKTNGFLLSIPLAILAAPMLYAKGSGQPRAAVKAVLAAATPGIGMLIYSAFIWRLTGDPLAWLKAHGAWGREYQGLAALVGDRATIIANAGVLGYVASLPYDVMNALGVVFVLAAVWPVARTLGMAYAVLILVFILPPLAAGGLVSAGRFSSVLFPAFLWMAGAVPRRHRGAWLASFAAIQALNAALFYTLRPLY